MKLLRNYALMLLVACAAMFNVRAEIIVLTATAGTNVVENAFAARAAVASLTLANPGGNALSVSLYDAPTNQTTYTNAEYISVARTISVVTNTVNNFNNDPESTYSLVATSTYVTNAAAAVSYRGLGTYLVPAGGSVTVTPAQFLQTSYGMTMKVNGVATQQVSLTIEMYRR